MAIGSCKMLVGGQEEIVRAGFGSDVHAALARGDHLRQGIGDADMKYVKRAVGQGGNLGGPQHCAGFQRCRTGTFMPDRLAMAGGDRVCTQLIENRPGFAVHDDSPTSRGHGAHDPQQGNIVKLHAVIRLVEFEVAQPAATTAGISCRRSFAPACQVGIVMWRPKSTATRLLASTRRSWSASIRDCPGCGVGEINHRCTTSAGRGHSSRDEAVRTGQTVEAHLKMDVAVNAAGNHVTAGGINRANGIQLCADSRDPALAMARSAKMGPEGMISCPWLMTRSYIVGMGCAPLAAEGNLGKRMAGAGRQFALSD